MRKAVRKRKTYRKKKTNFRKTLANVKQIAGAVEPKQITGVDAGFTATTISFYTAWTFIEQGDEYNQRSGRKINIVNTELHFSLYNTSATTVQTSRFFILRYKGHDPATMTTASLLSPATPYGCWFFGAGEVNYTNKKNRLISKKSDVVVLYDSGVLHLDPISAANTATGGMAGKYKRIFNFKKSCNWAINYNGAAATDDGAGSVYFCAISSSADVGYSYGSSATYIDV